MRPYARPGRALTQPTLVEVTDATTTGKNDGSATNDSAITLAKPLKAAKVFDYYTGALPEPQKGEPITIPLGESANIYAYETSGKKFKGSQDLSALLFCCLRCICGSLPGLDFLRTYLRFLCMRKFLRCLPAE